MSKTIPQPPLRNALPPKVLAAVAWTLPGLSLTAAVAVAALGLGKLEAAVTGRAWLEPLVLAILLGSAVRTLWTPPQRFAPGVHLAGKTLLELAVAMMGATVSFAALAGIGPGLVAAIVVTVALAIGLSFMIGRTLKLPRRMALLIACGNAICGNSAIAAVAPVIDADSEDVAAAIAFTAVLGIVVVLAVPVLAHVLGLSGAASGVLAGLTVYAVPQVIAAAGPMGAAAVQTGTLVKLVRVLMLGPVVTGLSLLIGSEKAPGETSDAPCAAARQRSHLEISRFAPPFILAFLTLAALNSLGWLPRGLAAPLYQASLASTVLAMAALGLGVDLRSLRAAGPRVVLVVTSSLVVLTLIAVAALRLLRLS